MQKTQEMTVKQLTSKIHKKKKLTFKGGTLFFQLRI